MDVRSLACFVVLSEVLNFRRAALQLNISQPALSQRLRVLESELGAMLMTRDKRHVELTPAGAAFLEPARLAVANAEKAKQQAIMAARGEAGQLRLGFTVIAAYGPVPEAVRLFRSRNPGVSVELHEMNSPSLEMALEAGTIDVAILHPPLDRAGLNFQSLADERMVLVLPTDHPLAKKTIVAIADLGGEPLMIAPRAIGPSIFDRMVALFRDAGVEPRIVQEITPMPTLASFVAAGVGIGFVTMGIAGSGRAGLSFRPVEPEPPGLPMAAAWYGVEPTATVKRLLAVLRELAPVLPEPVRDRAGNP